MMKDSWKVKESRSTYIHLQHDRERNSLPFCEGKLRSVFRKLLRAFWIAFSLHQILLLCYSNIPEEKGRIHETGLRKAPQTTWLRKESGPFWDSFDCAKSKIFALLRPNADTLKFEASLDRFFVNCLKWHSSSSHFKSHFGCLSFGTHVHVTPWLITVTMWTATQDKYSFSLPCLICTV